MKTEEIFKYVQKQYGTVPEYLWSKSPDSAVLRHKNGKWYAVIMTGLRHLREIKITINRRNAGFFMSNFIYFYVVRGCILSLYVI